MPSLSELNYLDLGVALIFLFFLIRGVWIGFMRQLAAFFALIGSYVIAGQYAGEILPLVSQLIEQPKLAFLVSFVLLFLGSAIIFTLIGKILQHLMHVTLLGWLDRLAGTLLGALKAAVLASLLYMFISSALSASNEMLATSYSVPYLQQGSELLRKAINDPRLREYFEEKKPAISELLPISQQNAADKPVSEQQDPPAQAPGEESDAEGRSSAHPPAEARQPAATP